MGKIRLLDDLTIKKIAAGEVIERPASVVKEMVENSIDAKADSITIEIKKGGKSYIRITDNGDGMEKEDLSIAFMKHSTSKLRTIEDLFSIMSLGFRGEALSSIASVAKVEVLTKTENSDVGWQAFVEDGEIQSMDIVGTPKGTTMIVRDLFYNLPVRKKFLKSDLSEGNYVSDIVNKLALGNTNISFKFIRDNKTILQTSKNNSLLDNIYNILGKETAKSLIPVDYEDSRIKLRGYISNSKLYRGNRGHQYLYVNGRFVINHAISKVIENQYKSLIPVNKFPIFVLYIEIDPKEIDVNIHPTKQEIKFSNSDFVYGKISNVVKECLMPSLQIPKFKMEEEDKEEEELPKLFQMDKEEDLYKLQNVVVHDLTLKEGKEEELNFFIDGKAQEASVDNHLANEKLNLIEVAIIEDAGGVADDGSSADLYWDVKNSNDLVEKTDETTDSFCDHMETEEAESEEGLDTFSELDFLLGDFDNKEISSMEIKDDKMEDNIIEEQRFDDILLDIKPIGRIFDTYIIAESKLEEKLIFIDQHAAHERIMYEKYKREFINEEVHVQMLMFPEIIELTDTELNLVRENMEIFRDLGFDIDEFGHNSIALRAVPIIFGNPSSRELFLDILDNLDMGIKTSYDTRVEKIMKIACTNAIKSGDNIKEVEIMALIEDLKACENPYTCPHGRPTIVEMSKKDFEKQFLRIM